jgi:chromosome condensin MukBEF ATPase and DNA-binding subunit MukB
MAMIPVEGHPNLYRDEKTGAIINYDHQGHNQYFNIVNNRKKQKEEIDTIKKDIDEIKTMLKEILNGTQ